jgi:hypothetical protein
MQMCQTGRALFSSRLTSNTSNVISQQIIAWGQNESSKEVFQMKKRHKIILNLLIVAFILFFFECGSQKASPIKIKSIKRAHRVLLGSSTRYQELTPKNSQTAEILVLKIKGISVDEFQNIQKSEDKEIYVAAGEQKFKPNFTRSGVIGGKRSIEIYVVVPKNALNLTLNIGAYPPRTFKVKGKIHDELRDW